MIKYIFLQAVLYSCVFNLDNGLGKTPPMGWNSWNHFGCEISEALIRETADELVNSGLAEKGYKYLNLDDCWQIDRNQSTKEIIEDKQKFPSGMPKLIEYIHSKKLLFGLYSDAGAKTCQGRPGSYGFEQIDARTYARWGVDYLKYDNCHNEGLSAKFRYPIMRDALNASGRHIYFSMCEWGREKPYEWAQNVANSWRTTLDIKDFWLSFVHNLQKQEKLAQYASVGAWNDPDMLEVGNGGMNHEEYQSHFALWAALKAPLLIGCNLKNISKQTLQILGNEEVIAINQDSLGKQADLISREVFEIGFKQIWGGELSNNRVVLIFFNRAETETGFTFSQTHEIFRNKKILHIRDVINHIDMPVPQGKSFETSKAKRHGVVNYVITLQK